jgi:PhzF family phenazine biosynthesis protein
METHDILVVDAFTAQPFRGNPAGVCFVTGAHPDTWMQAVAAEMKHAETAFVSPRPDGSYDLRWWTPETEVSLCGHATLASAHALFETGRLPPDEPAVFHTQSGELRATRAADGGITLDFPVATLERPADAPDLADMAHAVVAALGTDPAPIARTSFFVLVELPDAAAIRNLVPDTAALRNVETDAVLVTARADDERFDVVCRVFGPRVGIPEDPVTGSAMCVLAPYWEQRLGTRLRVAQLSDRGGELLVERSGDRVLIAGHAVTVLRAELLA